MSTPFSSEYEHVHDLERACARGDLGALDELLSFYDRILRADPGTRDAELSEYGPIYDPLGRLTGDGALQARVCGWLLPLAPRCSVEQREALRISFLELWPEEPVSWPQLEAIWLSFWNVPETRWVVLDAYHRVPLKLAPHHERFAALARSRGLKLAPLGETEHAEFLLEHTAWYNSHDVAEDLEEIVAEPGMRSWLWDQWIHQPLGDPELDALRQRLATLDAAAPATLDRLREEAQRLRAEPPAAPGEGDSQD
jgi:hypothetical protein